MRPRANDSQRQLRQMIRRQRERDLRTTFGRNMNGTHNPLQNDMGK